MHHPHSKSPAQPQKCQGDPTLVTLIHSAPKNFQLRDTIRRTWGKKKELKKNELKISKKYASEFNLNHKISNHDFLEYKSCWFK